MSHNMGSEVYVFGYQSILAAGSLTTSIVADTGEFVPAQLNGYVRDWSAVRTFGQNETKRYVYAKDWRIAERVAFANLTPSANRFVNGVCRRISSAQILALDYREQGYKRIDVTRQVSPYYGFTLETSVPCYAYISSVADLRPAMVSQAYYDMGYLGAAHIDKLVPNFLDDYLQSTEPLHHLNPDLLFVFLSSDGRHLWLLEESDSSLVLLHRFNTPQITPITPVPAELNREITQNLKWLDLRHRTLSHSTGDRRIPPQLVYELQSAEPDRDTLQSRFWLCRLAALERYDARAQEVSVLADDVDYWVSRAARKKWLRQL